MKAILLTFLLTVDPTELLAENVPDKLFSIVLLSAFAVWMIRRQNKEEAAREKLQERFEKSVGEDRERMLKVIENNTLVMGQVMEQIRTKH